MATSFYDVIPSFNAPGRLYSSKAQIDAFIDYSRMIRDQHVWDYPILPGAIVTYKSIVAGREMKVSGRTARGVSRVVEWLNNAVSYNGDGTVDRGFEPIVARRVLDYLCVGRTVYHVPPNGDLEYLDPTDLRSILQDGIIRWQSRSTGRIYSNENLYFHHPIPIGGSGAFISPVYPIIPTAMLAWLIREHDQASADGRKIRDIFIVASRQLADSLIQSVQNSLAAWSGDDASRNNAPVAVVENIPTGLTVGDLVHRLGLAEIPESLNRADFDFSYANIISSNLGISLRHFYNSEKATNRALEEVQEVRQQLKGPNSFTRSEQRLLNHMKLEERFGPSIRVGFVEEQDIATQETKGRVLTAYSTALKDFAKVLGATVNGEAFVAWLQSEDILPPDLELLVDPGVLEVTDQTQTNAPNATTDKQPSMVASGKQKPRKDAPAEKEKSVDPLEQGEISMNLDGKIIDQRRPTFSFSKAIRDEIMRDDKTLGRLSEDVSEPDYLTLLSEARKTNWAEFKSLDLTAKGALKVSDLAEYHDRLFEVDDYDSLTEDDHRMITTMMRKIRK